jgi:hypothetical protein
MAPILWEWFGCSFTNYYTRAYEVLIDPRSNAMANLRSFTLRKSKDSDPFLTALPRDRLDKFVSNVKLDRNTFRTVVQTYRYLRMVDVLLLESFTRSSSMAPYLTQVKEIVAFVHVNPDMASGSFNFYHTLTHDVPSSVDSLLAFGMKTGAVQRLRTT